MYDYPHNMTRTYYHRNGGSGKWSYPNTHLSRLRKSRDPNFARTISRDPLPTPSCPSLSLLFSRCPPPMYPPVPFPTRATHSSL